MRKTKKVDTNVHVTIIPFYEKDNISCVLLFKIMTKVVKDQFGSKSRAPLRVTELTIKDSFGLFCEENKTRRFPILLLKIIDQIISD